MADGVVLVSQGCGCRTRASSDNGGPRLESAGRWARAHAPRAGARGRTAISASARAVSAPAQSRCHSVLVRAKSLAANRPDRDW